MDPKIPHLHLTMRVNFGVPLRPPSTRPEDLEEGVMEAVVRSEAVSDLKFRLQQCRTNCDLRGIDPDEPEEEEEEDSAEVAAAITWAQAKMRVENGKIASGELREQDLWECGDGDQSPLTQLEYEKLYKSGWGTHFLFNLSLSVLGLG